MSLECVCGTLQPKPPQGDATNTRADDASSSKEGPEDPSLLGGSEQNKEGDPVQPGRLQEDQLPKHVSESTMSHMRRVTRYI